MKTLTTATADQTLDLGERLGRAIAGQTSIALTGDLGCGKTTLVQGLARGLGVDPSYYITSPTFNILNQYPSREFQLCHLDLYRLGSTDELAYIGFDDLLETDSVIVVEWPGLLKDDGFHFDLEMDFSFDGDYNRLISVSASGQTGAKVLSNLFL